MLDQLKETHFSWRVYKRITIMVHSIHCVRQQVWNCCCIFICHLHIYFYLKMMHCGGTICFTVCSSVASPICQEGQSERTFPIFAFSSRFFLCFPDFSLFFPIFCKFFAVRGGTLPPPLTPPVATPLTVW